jgi:hypothetical protein
MPRNGPAAAARTNMQTPAESSIPTSKCPTCDVKMHFTGIMQKEEKAYDGCGNKRAIHVANRCRDKLHRVSAERHSRHDRRYAASI